MMLPTQSRTTVGSAAGPNNSATMAARMSFTGRAAFSTATSKAGVGSTISWAISRSSCTGRSAPNKLRKRCWMKCRSFSSGGRSSFGCDLRQSFAGGQHGLLEHRRVQLLLVAEMVIHGGDVGVAPAADLPQRGCPIADVGKNFRRCGQEPVVGFPTALIFGHLTPRSGVNG